jgi:hypothetical protein
MSTKATAIFDGNDSGLQRTVRGIKGALRGLQGNFRTAAAGISRGVGNLASGGLQLAGRGLIGLSTAGVAAGVGLAYGVKRAYDLGGELNDMSAKTGIAVDQLMILNQAGKDAGIENLSGAVAKMQKNLAAAASDGASPAARALDALGLSAGALLQRLPTEQFQLIGARIAAIQNPALRTAAAMEVFGKSGAELLPLFANSGALGEAATAIGKQAAILRDNAAGFDAVSDRLGHAGLKLQGFFVGVAVKVLPLLDAVTTRLAGLDLATQGERFGEGIKTAVNFLAGAFADPAALFGTAVQFLKAGVLGAGNLFIAGIKLAGSLLGSPDLLSGLARGFAGLGMILQAGLMRAFSVGISYLQAGLEIALEKLPVSMGGKRSVAGEAKEKLAANLALQEALVDRLNKLKSDPMVPDDKRAEWTSEVTEKLRALVKDSPRLTREANSGPTLSERAQSLRDGSDTYGSIEDAAKEKIAEGKRNLANGISGTFDAAIAAFKTAEVKDVLGAAAPLAKGMQGARQITRAGAVIVARATAPGAAPQQIMPGARTMEGYNYTLGLSTASRGSSLVSSSQMGGLYGGAYGVHRRGDSARAKAEAAAKKEKDKTVERSNELLGGIAESAKKTVEALT